MRAAQSIDRTVVVLGCLVAIACASSGSPGARDGGPDEPPRMISRTMPDLRIGTPTSGVRHRVTFPPARSETRTPH